MSVRQAIASVVIASALVAVGCEQEEAPVTPSPANTGTPTVDQAREQRDQAVEQAEKAGDAAVETAKDMAEGAEAQIESLFNEAKTAIENNNLDSARGIVTRLEGLKANIPADMQGKIDGYIADLRKMIEDKAKAVMGDNMPSMPK
jgi:vacuolar-type H+-ATPase subunit H